MENNNTPKEPLHEVTEGPYYKKDSPERNNIAGSDAYGEKLIVEGRVLDIGGQEIKGQALVCQQAQRMVASRTLYHFIALVLENLRDYVSYCHLDLGYKNSCHPASTSTLK